MVFQSHTFYMEQAIIEAQKAYEADEVPVGAVLVEGNGIIIARYHNKTQQDTNPTAHAEMLCIIDACKKTAEKYLTKCRLYVTLEPCCMCAGAIAHAHLGMVVFGAYDYKSGGVEHGARVFHQHTTHHKPEVIGGVCETTCQQLLSNFFKQKRCIPPI